MKMVFAVSSLLTLATHAMAHDSSVPHVHPHGVSVLPDLAAMLAAAAVVAVGVLVVRLFGRG